MDIFDGTDCCVAPVLSLNEAPHHPHNQARTTFIETNGVTQPVPAPRFSATPAPSPTMPGRNAADTDTILADIGYPPARIAALKAARVLG